MDWIPENVHRTDIPTVDDFPWTLYSGYLRNRGIIPLPELQNFANFDLMPERNVLKGWRVFHSMAEINDMAHYVPIEEEECKVERSPENDVMEGPQQERTLDAIFHHDDGDETKSLIWVQCRLCKWSTPVEAFVERPMGWLQF
jgi:hypothetical protein